MGREGQVGEAVARALAERGATMLLVDRGADNARERATGLTSAGHRAYSFGCDLADEQSVRELVERVRRDHGERLSAVIHAAGGFALSGPLPESDVEVWQRMITINLTTAYLVTRAFLPLLRTGKGAIVYFASEAALPGAKVGATAAYAAAKGGLLTYTKGLAKELAPYGVRVNGIAPGVIWTPYHERYSPPDMFQKYLASIPLGRAGTAEEVAEVIVFLASPAARYMTGETVEVNGGMWMD